MDVILHRIRRNIDKGGSTVVTTTSALHARFRSCRESSRVRAYSFRKPVFPSAQHSKHAVHLDLPPLVWSSILITPATRQSWLTLMHHI
jgi:hypothetical protein